MCKWSLFLISVALLGQTVVNPGASLSGKITFSGNVVIH